MNIYFMPQCGYGEQRVVKDGDSLSINGELFDFSSLKDGETLPSSAIECDHVVGSVSRVNGEVEVAIISIYSEADTSNINKKPMVNAPDGVIL